MGCRTVGAVYVALSDDGLYDLLVRCDVSRMKYDNNIL